MREVTEALLGLLERGERGALATVVATGGSAPQAVGARMLLGPDGAFIGTVGGGAIELAVQGALEACLRGREEAGLRRWDLTRDLGMCCGGRMEVFIERVEGQPRLILFGAGHVAQPTAEIAKRIGFRVVVVDDREALNTEARFPGCTRLLYEPAEAAEALKPNASDWLLIVTHDHRLDEEALHTYARRPHAYLGLIGSRRKIYRIVQRIAARGPLPSLERVYAPVGLDLGAISPEEIAVSIAAELVALRHGRAARHMRALDDPALAKVLGGELTPELAARALQPAEGR